MKKKTQYLILMVAYFLLLTLISPLITVLVFPDIEVFAYITQLFPFALALGITGIIYKKITGESIFRLYTLGRKFSLRRFFTVFGATIAIGAISVVMNRNDYHFTTAPWTVVTLSILLTLLLMPLQVMAEELLFRCLPLRIVTDGRIPGNGREKGIAILFSALLFASMHLGNPEIKAIGIPVILVYLAIGGALMLFSVLEGGFESALAYHMANNLFLAIAANYSSEVTVLKSSPLFISTGEFNILYSLLEFLVITAVVLLIIRFQKIEAKEKKNG